MTNTTPSRKATHSGTCQCCGRFQKLPGNRLSKHGYTVNWGFFNGTCPGADHQPYELTCNDIKAVYLPNAQRQLASVKARVAALRIPTASNEVQYRKYESTKYNAPFKTLTGTLVVEKHPEHGYSEFFVVEADGTKLPTDRHTGNSPYHVPYGSSSKTALEVINENRRNAADQIERTEVSELTRYIAWQSDRIANWKLAPLVETPEDYVSPAQEASRAKRALATAKTVAKHQFDRLRDRIEDKTGLRHSTIITAANVHKYLATARALTSDPDRLAPLDELEAAYNNFLAAKKAQEDATPVMA